MFTGIITDVGNVRALEQEGDLRARIAAGYDTAGIDMGASIACDGVCLTVVAIGRRLVRCGYQRRNRVARPTLRAWAEGRRVNLERALQGG